MEYICVAFLPYFECLVILEQDSKATSVVYFDWRPSGEATSAKDLEDEGMDYSD
jgi:hypothetical protein